MGSVFLAENCWAWSANCFALWSWPLRGCNVQHVRVWRWPVRFGHWRQPFLAENPNNHQLSYNGKITLKADPLLAVECDVDIKEIISRMLGPAHLFSKFLEEAISKSENIDAGIELKLKAKTDIRGDLQWKRTAEQGSWSVEAKHSTISGSMGLKVTGKVYAEARAFGVRAAAGASVVVLGNGGKELSKFTLFWAALEGAENPVLERQMSFNGLAIYYSYYTEFGADESQTGKAINEAVQRVSRRGDQKSSKIKKKKSENLFESGDKNEMKELCILMKEWNGNNESIQMGKDTL